MNVQQAMNKIIPASLVAGLLMIFFCLSGVAFAERYHLDITAPEVRKIVVAVPDFQDLAASTANQGRSMADLMSRGLAFHGFIDIVSPEKYGANPNADWKSYGVDYVVLGKYKVNAQQLLVEGRLLDVADDRLLSGRRYNGAVGQQDEMVLRLCDALVEEFTGQSGISRSRLAFVSDASGKKEVYVTDVLGRNLRQVTKHRHLTVSPRFTPDGINLAYSSYHTGNQNLYITDLRQSKTTRAISRRKGMNLAPAFSPDGKTMVVTLSKDGSPDLYLLDRQGKILKRLTSGMGINVSPSFSPDGKSLLFVSDRSGRPQIYLMDMQSHKSMRLTRFGKENTEPCWSPKGDRIAYTALVDGRYQIMTMDPVAGAEPKQVSSGWGEFESPTWSPDGRQIAFSRRRNGKQELCTVQSDGKGLRVLFKLQGNQSYPQWVGPMK